MRATFPSHLIPLDLITVNPFGVRNCFHLVIFTVEGPDVKKLWFHCNRYLENNKELFNSKARRGVAPLSP
jgi:hypothetical protein